MAPRSWPYDVVQNGPLPENLRHLLRLTFDLAHLDERRYEHAARALDVIGRQIGAWRKQAASGARADRADAS